MFHCSLSSQLPVNEARKLGINFDFSFPLASHQLTNLFHHLVIYLHFTASSRLLRCLKSDPLLGPGQVGLHAAYSFLQPRPFSSHRAGDLLFYLFSRDIKIFVLSSFLEHNIIAATILQPEGVLQDESCAKDGRTEKRKGSGMLTPLGHPISPGLLPLTCHGGKPP